MFLKAAISMVAPAKIPKTALKRVSEAFVQVINAPETRGMLEKQGMLPGTGDAQEVAALIRTESRKYAKLIKTAGVKIN